MTERGFRRGFFHPTHPEKYLGDLNRIVFRSSWEMYAFKFLDLNKSVLRWGSEIISIPYLLGNTVKQYFPDLYVEYLDKDKSIIKEIIEIKPSRQAMPSKSKNKKVRLQEDAIYNLNMLKWIACKAFCNKIGIHFRVLTEKELFKLK